MRKAAPEFREPPFGTLGHGQQGAGSARMGENLSEKLIRNPRIRIDFFLSLLYDCYNKWILGSWPCCRDLLKKTVRRAQPGRLGRS